jgi:hypothetical protein
MAVKGTAGIYNTADGPSPQCTDSTEWTTSTALASHKRQANLFTAVPPSLIAWLDPWDADHSAVQLEVRMRLVVEFLAPSERRAREAARLQVKRPIIGRKVICA